MDAKLILKKVHEPLQDEFNSNHTFGMPYPSPLLCMLDHFVRPWFKARSLSFPSTTTSARSSSFPRLEQVKVVLIIHCESML